MARHCYLHAIVIYNVTVKTPFTDLLDGNFHLYEAIKMGRGEGEIVRL